MSSSEHSSPPKSSAKTLVLAIAVIALVGGAAGAGFLAGRGKKDGASPSVVTTIAGDGSNAKTVIDSTVVADTAVADPIVSSSFSITKIQKSMLQIRTQGTYREFAQKATTSPGAGSGFLISADGLAVTNNHVVAGAATIDVYIGGGPKAYPARVLGRSECSDLALLKIDGDTFTPLRWSSAAPTPGVDVYAAGFPLGESEPTITKGIISKAKANGNMAWASVDHVIEHDANIQPGNSGGALVTADGRVVGVNFAGGDSFGTGTAQFFAIASDLAQPVIDRLKQGNFETLGVNAQAFRDPEKNVSGVWVAAVQDGSPAAQVGLQAGDIITTMRGLPVGLDGTMRDYCKIIRSSNDTEAIGVEVYRPDTKTTFSGEFRGRELTESFSFSAPDVAGSVKNTDPSAKVDDPYTYVRVKDDSGRISVDVPTVYSEVEGAEFPFDGGSAPAIIASPDAGQFKAADEPKTPGLFISAIELAKYGVPAGTSIPQGTYDQLLDTFSKTVSTTCSIGDRSDFDRNGVVGRFQVFGDCGSAKTSTFVVIAAPPDSRYLLVIIFVAKDENDLFALDRAVSTFRVQ
jgi:serine protease Do